MNWRHIRLIIRREYLDRLRSPSFVIGTVLGVIGIIALSFLPQLFQVINQETTMKVAVLDNKNLIFPYLPKNTDPTPAAQSPAGVDTQSAGLSARILFYKPTDEDPTVLGKQVKDGKIGSYIVVLGDKASDAQFEMHVKDRPGTVAGSRILLLLTTAATQARIRESGITPEQATALFSTPSLTIQPVEGATLKDEKAQFQAQALVYVLLILLYMTTLMYGLQVAMGVVYEKSSRVIEILISTVRPIELMLGKVIGIGLLGLTQYLAWVLVGLAGFVISAGLGSGSGSAGNALELASVPPATLIAFLVFFILGYLVYAALYAALGSLVNRTEEVNSITTPITLIVVGVYLLSMVALANPDADYIRWLSFLPFLSPMLMFIRVALSSPAWWEPVVAVALLVASVFFFSWLAAKIYRIGVLMYGKRPSFREIGRMIRAT